MTDYQQLAMELFMLFDDKTRVPPHEEMSASLRGEMAVMRLLARQARLLTAGEISRELHMTTSRVAAVLGSLEKKGFIARGEDAHDRRRVQVLLTELGKAQHEEKKGHVMEDMRFLLEQLGEADAREFVRLMRRVQQIDPPHLKERREKQRAKCSGTGGRI